MSTPLRVLLRGAVGLVVAGVALVLGAAAAGASGHDVEEGVDVRVPIVLDGRTAVGEARIARERTLDGVRLVVDVSVPGGFTSSTICISEQPFVRPSPPARCVDRHGAGTSHRYEAAVPADAERHVQVRVGVRGGVAWAGWQPGPPASGSVEVPTLPVLEDPPLPEPDAVTQGSATLVTVVTTLDDGVEDPEDPPLPEPIEGCGVDEAASTTGIAASTGTDGRPAACAGRDGPGRPAPRA